MSEDMGNYHMDEFIVDHLTRPADFDMGHSHSHPYYEIYYVEAGQCRIFIGHKIYYMNPGDMALVIPSRLHRTLYGAARAVRRYTVCFTPRHLSLFTQESPPGTLDQVFSREKLSVPASLRPELEMMLSSMEREAKKQDLYSEICGKSILFQMLIFLKRCEDGARHSPAQRLEPADEAVQAAADYIHQCHRNPVTLESAAKTAHMSPSYFSKKFKESTGFGFREYLNHVRIQDSLELLTGTGLSITQIALTCGFSDGNYFGDVFRKIKGISPSQYRKAMRQFKESPSIRYHR